MRLGYWLLLLILVLPTGPKAGVELRLYADQSGESCTIGVNENELVAVQVLLSTYAEQVTGVRFAAPIPPAAGLTHVGDVSSYYLTGNSQVDVSVPFGTCISGPIVIMTMYFYPSSAGEDCTYYEFQPGALYTDCSFGEHSLVFTAFAVINRTGNYNVTDPGPVDGAQDVPLVTLLQWTTPCLCNPFLHGDTAVYFGTSATPPLIAYGDGPVGVGPLTPSTTYYWKVWHHSASEAGPIWSFTTTNSVAVQSSTWGAIKALYR